MKKLILFSVFIMCVFGVYAQVKVKSTGRVISGPELINNDPDNIINLHVFGSGAVGCNGRIAIGDYGRASTGSCNIVVGEYSNYDSDQLWLHGKNGIYLTYNNGSSVIGSYDVRNGNKFSFNCELWSSGVKLTSDERLKTNVNKISGSMTNLRKLNGVSYNLLQKESVIAQKGITKSAKVSDTVKLSEKEQKDKTFFEAYEANVKNAKPKRMGFLAQDLQKIFPELVEKDSSGYFSVDYIGLIPVIIEALKEQDSIISTQNIQIKALQKSIKNSGGLKSAQVLTDPTSTTASVATLSQNVPNPFNQTTEIGYFLPETTQKAVLYIYNMNGLQLKSIPIQNTGNGSVTINGSEFQPGMYIYTLVADGHEIDTKRMILTQ